LEKLLKGPRDVSALLSQVGSHPCERGGGIVAERAIGFEQPPRGLEELVEVGQPPAARRQMRSFDRSEVAADCGGGASDGEDRSEVGQSRRAARSLERVENRPDLLDAREPQSSMVEAELDELGGLVDRPSDRLFVECGNEPTDGRLAGRGSREGGDQEEDDVELESLVVDVALRPGLES
jgi:hypothetical protein